MAEFKVAEAYADFHVNVDKGLDEAVARIKARSKDFDDVGRSSGGAAGKALGEELKKETGLSTEDTAKRMRGKKQRFEDAGDELGKSAGKGFAKGAKDVDKETEKVAKRTQSKFEAIKFLGLSVGLPAAAAIGAAGVTASLAIAAGAFVALGVAGAISADQVQGRIHGLSSSVQADVRAMSEPMQTELVGAVDDVGAAWTRMRPQVIAAVGASAPAVRTLTGAVTDLAENAMPGMLTAVKASGPVLLGVRTFAGQAGAGLGQFFAEASKGNEGAAKGFTIFGGTVQTLEQRLGQLFANTANGSAGPLRSLDTIVDQLTGGLVTLTGAGSGAVGALQGFSTAGSGLATVLRGVMTVAAALPPQITQFAGSFGAASMLAQRFGVDVGASFKGIGENIKAAEGGRAKLGAGLMGMASGVFSPATLGVAALSLGLSILGQEQERASMYAAQHRDNVRSLTDAIRQDNGVMGEHVAAVNVAALTAKNASANLAVYGGTLGDAKLAIEGNSDAYDRLNYSSRAAMVDAVKNMGITGDQAAQFKDLATQALNTGQSYDQLKGNTTALTDTFQGAGGDAIRHHIEAIVNANGAVGEQIRAQKEAREAYLQSEGALNDLTTAQVAARDATTEHTNAVNNAVGGELAYRGAVDQTRTQLADYIKVGKDSKATEDQKAAALLGVENAMHQQITAAGQAAAATAIGKSANEQASLAAAAMNRETVQLANTWAGPLPASLQAGIGKMSVSQAVAAGLTVTIDGTGAAVYRLPNGKFIKIESSAEQEAAKVQMLRDKINSLHDQDVKITVTTFYGTVGKGSSLTGPPVARAHGGMVAAGSTRRFARGGLADGLKGYANGGMPLVDTTAGGMIADGPGTTTSDSMLGFAFSKKEFITNALATARNLSELRAINNGQRNYEQYPDTGGRPPGPQRAQAPVSVAPVTNNFYVTATEADPARVAAKVSSEVAWAARGSK